MKKMKKITFSILMIIAVLEIKAQDYQITFAGTGASTSVDSVKVENLSQCTSLALAGTDTLILTSTLGMNETSDPHDYPMNIYPNPSPGNFEVEFEETSNSNVCIVLYDMTGKAVLQRNEFLQEGKYVFQLRDVPGGAYIMKVESDRYLYSAILISNREGTSCNVTHGIKPAGRTKELMEFIGIRSVIRMQFNAGDTLKLTGKSGIYSTIIMTPSRRPRPF